MKSRHIMWFAALTLFTTGLTACASFFGGSDVQVRSVENASVLGGSQSDGFYESAKTAINVRDYARALDYLQEARSGAPNNVQVLNALGVVYDKLGRFDLSTRYYAQARALDPTSQIVARNIAYSKILQGLLNPGLPTAVASAQAPVSSVIVSPEETPVDAQTPQAVLAALPAVPRGVVAVPDANKLASSANNKKVLTIGHPIRIMNASGQADRTGPISRRLTMLGWTMRPSEDGRIQQVTTLFYSPQNAVAAQAMQHTLPFAVRLASDTSSTGLRLVIGRDYLTWKPKNARLAALWQRAPVVASLSKVSFNGGR